MYSKIIHSIAYSLYILLCFVICNSSFAQIQQDHSFYFLPQAGILLDYSILESHAGFTGKQSKALDLLIFSYDKFNLSTYVKEDIYTSARYNSTYYPYRIAYYMDFAWISFSLENSKIGIIFNHICYNTFDKQKRNIGDELRWYGIGIKWQSNGMQIGNNNRAFDNKTNIFNLNNFNYSFDISYPFMSKIPEYKYIGNLILRYDIPITPIAIPYFEMHIKGLLYANNELAIDRSIESGVKIPLGLVELKPYLNYEYIHDSLYPGMSDNQIGFGFKAESLIDHDFFEDRNYYSPPSLTNDISMHFIAGYAKNLSSNYYNFTTDFGITLQAFFENKNNLYFSSFLTHSSEDKLTALYPRFINILLKTAYEYSVFNQHFVLMAYEHLRRHDGNQYRGQTEYYHAIKLGFKHSYLEQKQNDEFNDSGYLFTYNNFEYELTLSFLLTKHNYPYSYIINPKVNYYFVYYHSWKPYISLQILYFTGKQNNYEYTIEHGFILNSIIPLIVYYSFKRDIDIDTIGGASDLYHVIGIRLKI